MSDIFDCMVLGDLIKKLECCDLEARVQFDFCRHTPGAFHSYRGFYEDLALTPDQSEITVSDFLKACKHAVGGTFTGWKGGEFRMGEDTRVWVASSGDATNTGIVAVKPLSWGAVILQTSYIDV